MGTRTATVQAEREVQRPRPQREGHLTWPGSQQRLARGTESKAASQ